jgi:predicted nucleic acid-binding protein
MDKLVVDSSVAVKWVVPEPHSAEARRILDAYLAGSLTLLAPDIIGAEIGNIAWKKHLFQGMPVADAENIVAFFRTVHFQLTPTGVLLEEAFKLAVTHKRSMYDSLYLALSVREGCRLVTADEKLVNAIGSQFPQLLPVAKWP